MNQRRCKNVGLVASDFLYFSVWSDFIRDGEKFVNKGQIRAVIQWIKDVQRDTIDINASNELEFVVMYLEAMEGDRDVV